MPFVSIKGVILPIEHNARRMERPAQWSPEHAIHESCAITRYRFVGVEVCQLRDKLFAQFMVGVERQHPFALHLIVAEIPLACAIVELPVNRLRVRKGADNIQCCRCRSPQFVLPKSTGPKCGRYSTPRCR